MMKTLALSLLVLVLAGCTSFRLIPAGTVELQGQMVVETPVAWNGTSDQDIFLWTLDGPALQQMIFHVGVQDGKTLFDKVNHEAKEHWLLKLVGKERDLITLKFRKSMTEYEIMDLFAATYTALYDGQTVSTDNLEPMEIGSTPGFRFDYSFTGKDEVRRRGIAAGTVMDEKLYLVHFQGSSIYHFERNRADAERIIASIVFKKKG